MKKSFLLAVAAALLTCASPVVAAEARNTISPASAKAIKAVQDAVVAKKYPEAVRKAAEALSMPARTPFDTFTTYGFLAYAHQAMGNGSEVLNAMQGQLDSGFPGPAEQNRIARDMMGIAFQMKDYPRVVEFGRRVVLNGNADANIYEVIAQAMAQQGKNADAARFLGDFVKDLKHRRQRPRESTLVALRSLQERAGDHGAAAETLEDLVINYSKPDYWNLVTYKLVRAASLNDRQKLQVYRLKVATGTLKRCQDFTEMADIAVAAGMAMEGLNAMKLALSARACPEKIDEDRVRRKVGSIGRVVAEDAKAFPGLEAAARKSTSGEADVAVGSQLFAKGDYAAAVDALSRGVSKGGLEDLADVQLTLAIAKYRSGKKTESLEMLHNIRSDSRETRQIVGLWILYVQ